MEITTDLVESYVALITMAVFPILIGSHWSAFHKKLPEKLSQRDAFMFPVIGSAALLSLYLCFKFLSRELVNQILQFYFLILGVGAVFKAIRPVTHAIIPFSISQSWRKEIRAPQGILLHISQKLFEFESVTLDVSDLFTLAVSMSVGFVYFQSKHWFTNNIFGISFCLASIEFIHLGSFQIGAIMLIGLFFYDIFWVFGTDVMVTVAKSFDAPIKLVWPRSKGQSLLGLGDIVVPGIFIALMLRFDKYLREYYEEKADKKSSRLYPNWNVYFMTCTLAYIAGLIMTVVVLTVFQAGQPALLYLVPACLGSVVLTAIYRGELSLLMNYSEEVSQEDSKVEEKKE